MSLEAVKSMLSTTGELLGTLLWWSLSDARIDRTALESLWLSAALSREHLPEPPTAEKALKTAVHDCALGQTGRLIRLGKEDLAEVVFAIVRESKHPDGSVSYSQEARVILDRTVERVSTDQPGHAVAESIKATFERLRATHTPDDVRRAMIKTLDACAAVTLRDHGGVYWVPAPYADTVRRLQTAVEHIGTSRVYVLPVHRSDDAARTLGDVAKSAVEQELEALKAEILGFLATPPERISTLVRRLDAFDDLRAKAELYRDILQVQVTDLEKTLSELSSSVERLLSQKQAA
jgi:hypothetical protein